MKRLFPWAEKLFLKKSKSSLVGTLYPTLPLALFHPKNLEQMRKDKNKLKNFQKKQKQASIVFVRQYLLKQLLYNSASSDAFSYSLELLVPKGWLSWLDRGTILLLLLSL